VAQMLLASNNYASLAGYALHWCVVYCVGACVCYAPHSTIMHQYSAIQLIIL